MITFSKDADILRYEPAIFGELKFPNQVLAVGAGGVLSGTTFTASGADFINGQITAGGVITLQSSDGLLDGAFEIVSVDSATGLTVSVLRIENDDASIPPPASSDISYFICTYAPQAEEAAFQLTEYFGIGPGNEASEVDACDIVDPRALRAACVFTVLSAVYATLASKAEDDNFWKKSFHYRKLFEKARERCQISLDIDSDGVTDLVKTGGSFSLARD
jgi:hypothetical protein